MTGTAGLVVPGYYALDGLYERHYVDEAFELLDDHDAYEAYYVCAAIKYGARAGRKTEDPAEDLAKLRDCLVRAIEHREARLHADADR